MKLPPPAAGLLTRLPARREAVDQTPEPPPAGCTFRMEPSARTRLIVAACMEIFADERATLLTCHPTIDLARRFDLFRADLFRAGFDVMMDRPQNRAKSFRWMGERAESRGDIDGAIVLYELAVRSWNAVGCKKRLGQLIKETRR